MQQGLQAHWKEHRARGASKLGFRRRYSIITQPELSFPSSNDASDDGTPAQSGPGARTSPCQAWEHWGEVLFCSASS